MKIKIMKGDITTLSVDAIVNAAKKSLMGGGGVDGAIHRAAGPSLDKECRTLNGCEVGEAKITSGYNLKAKYIIHTVGPVWNGGENGEERLLANCYRNCLKIATEFKINSIAFPAISTGVYRFPKLKAANIALRTVIDEGKNLKGNFEVYFVAYDKETFDIYNTVYNSLKV